MRSTEHISRWPKAAKRERRRDQDGHREATSGRQYGTGINQHVAREAQRSGFFFFFFFARTRSAQYKGIQGVACGLTLAPTYRIGETLRIVLVT